MQCAASLKSSLVRPVRFELLAHLTATVITVIPKRGIHRCMHCLCSGPPGRKSYVCQNFGTHGVCGHVLAPVFLINLHLKPAELLSLSSYYIIKYVTFYWYWYETMEIRRLINSNRLITLMCIAHSPAIVCQSRI